MKKGTSILRELNKRKALSLVRRLKQTTRKDLVKEMGVSKNTVSLVIDELMKDGIIEEVGITESTRKGRPKILLQIKPDSFKSIGITVNKRSIDYTVINYDGHLIEELTIPNNSTDAPYTIETVGQILESLLQKHDKVIGVGIGIPGIINEEKLLVPISTHLNWKNVSLNHLTRFDVPITIQNIANIGAHSAINDEHLFESKSLFYVRVSEGVGGAFLINDVIIPGHTWTAGEIGHISVDPTADRCRCGQKGCLESLINVEQFKNEMAKYKIEVTEDGGYFKSENDDDLLFKTVSKYGRHMGASLVSVMHLLNPKTIIIDTPYNKFPFFKDECLNYLENHCLDKVYNETAIIFGDKRYSMSKGAAHAAIIKYEKHGY